jgi:hypothetical protein
MIFSLGALVAWDGEKQEQIRENAKTKKFPKLFEGKQSDYLEI